MPPPTETDPNEPVPQSLTYKILQEDPSAQKFPPTDGTVIQGTASAGTAVVDSTMITGEEGPSRKTSTKTGETE
jgi:hypothetical protein